jgi:hypothetical protein
LHLQQGVAGVFVLYQSDGSLEVKCGIGGEETFLCRKLLTAEVALFERPLTELLLQGNLSA